MLGFLSGLVFPQAETYSSQLNSSSRIYASQLAKAVCLYSPWQFIYWYDRPVNSPNKAGGAGGNDIYIAEVPELIFFDQLPTTWDDTKVIQESMLL